MPKATHTDTTPTPAPDARAVTPHTDALVRLLWMASETDEQWNRRDPTNKAMCAVTGAAERLGGLSEICYDLTFAEMAKGGRKPENGATSANYFLARTLADISRSLIAAHRLYSPQMAAEDADAIKPRTKRAVA